MSKAQIIALSVLLLAAGLSAPAFAESEGEEGPYETVVVDKKAKDRVESATFTDTPWLELPQSVQTVDSATLREWGADTANDAWKMAAGFQPQDQDLQSRGGGLESNQPPKGKSATDGHPPKPLARAAGRHLPARSEGGILVDPCTSRRPTSWHRLRDGTCRSQRRRDPR